MATVMAGGTPERVPYWCYMHEDYWRRLEQEAGRPLTEVYQLDWGERYISPSFKGKPPWDQPWGDKKEVSQEEELLKERFHRYLPEDTPAGLRVSEYGAITVPGSMYHLRRMIYPLRDATGLDEIERFPWPDVAQQWRWSEAEKLAPALAEQGYWIGASVGSIFETSWFIRGQEQLLVDIYENPEFAAALLDRVAADREYTAVRMVKLGADSLALGDDMGHQRGPFMSPADLRKWIISRWERVIGAAKAVKPDIKVDFHTDGRCEEMIPDLMAIGVTAINPVQPECDDPEHLKKTFGSKLVLKGTVSAHVLTFGRPRDVREEIRTRMATAWRWGGMVIGPNNTPDVNTPYENFKAFLDSCEEFSGRVSRA